MSASNRLMPIVQFAENVKTNGQEIYLRQPINGEYLELSWAETYSQTLRFASGLRSLGLEAGDKVAILSENCAEWFIADFAICAAGLVSVPIYFTAGESVISHVLEHSEAKAIVVGKLASFSAVEQATPNAVKTISMSFKSMPCQYDMPTLIRENEELSEIHEPNLDDVFSLSYTSGSTGKPKGVVLSYRNIVFGANTMSNWEDRPPKERVISYLPLAHITERALIEYASLYNNVTVTFNESLATFLDDLKSAQVTSFISVPRLWMKFQAGVLANLPQKKLDRLLKIPVVSGMVKKKIRTQLGLAHATSFGSGSAPVAASVLEWYYKLGMPISEGWGMTELTAMGTSQYPFRADKIGTIGCAIDGLEVSTSDEGELLVRGDGVFKEYYKDEENTKNTFTHDGWMRTGDKAEMDDDGYFRITGRVKELFKSGKGKYVAPVPIESLMVKNQLIEQICVMGSGLPQPVAVIVVAPETSVGMSEVEIQQSLLNTMADVNSQIEKHECLGGLCLAKESWSIENGLLTPTLKIKRDQLEGKYGDVIGTIPKGEAAWA